MISENTQCKGRSENLSSRAFTEGCVAKMPAGIKETRVENLLGTNMSQMLSNFATAQLRVLNGQGPAASPIPSPGRNQ